MFSVCFTAPKACSCLWGVNVARWWCWWTLCWMWPAQWAWPSAGLWCFSSGCGLEENCGTQCGEERQVSCTGLHDSSLLWTADQIPLFFQLVLHLLMKELCGMVRQQGSDKFKVNCEEKLEMCFVLSDRVHLWKHVKQPLMPCVQMAQRWDDRFNSHHLQEGQRAGFRLREYLLCYASQPSNFLFRNLWWRPTQRWNRFALRWRSSSEAVQASLMCSKADAKVRLYPIDFEAWSGALGVEHSTQQALLRRSEEVTIDHPNIRDHARNRLVEQRFIKSGRWQ